MRILLISFVFLIFFPANNSLAASKKVTGLCNNYGSRVDYMGNRYYIRDPENGRVVRQHFGIDFCTKAGTEVLAAADGWVFGVVWDNPVRGGQVIIRAKLRGLGQTAPATTIYVRHLHITPDPNLHIGKTVKAGSVLGTVQKGGKEQIGPRSHVHFDAGKCDAMWLCPIDPNAYWADGPGKVSCYDAKAPPPTDKLVVPIPCRRP